MRIAVIGAAGYVGQSLCSDLAAAGHEVIGITRPNGALLLKRLGVQVRSPGQARSVGPLDAVLNLAYPKGPGFEAARENRILLALIQDLAGERARIVHASSIAVFGYALEHPVAQGPVARRRDYSYIESKIELEHLLMQAFAGRKLDIVRLGNVWGPASPTWTAALAQRILFGEPVGVAGVDGYSNVTDVANAASYLAFLAADAGGRATRFHHLAELGELRWSHWIGKLEAQLGIPAIHAGSRGPYPRGLASEVFNLLKAYSPMAMARQALQGRFAASWALSALALLPPSAIQRLEEVALKSSTSSSALTNDSDAPFLEIMCAGQPFASNVQPGWSPPVDAPSSWSRVQEWLERSGYDRRSSCPG